MDDKIFQTPKDSANFGFHGMSWDLEVVARDGIEPPPPAFSGPPTDGANWSGISVNGCGK
jgi:hypothetical protein